MSDPNQGMDYRRHVAAQERNLQKYLTIHSTCACPKGEHFGAASAFACDHVIEQDPVNPAGIVRMPKGYFLCRDCLALLAACKFQFVYEIKVTCAECVWAEIGRITALGPDRFVDRMPPGTSPEKTLWKA